MSPEFGSTCAIFPIDGETHQLPRTVGPRCSQVALVEAYAKEQGLWRSDGQPDALYTDVLELDHGNRRAEHRRTQTPAGPYRSERCRYDV